MPMIQQVDGGYLLNALRAGRQDRMAQQEYESQQAARQQAAERQQRVTGLMEQYISGEQPQGMQDMVAPPQGAPQGAPQGTMGAPMGGVPQPAGAPMGQAPPRQRNPDLLRQLAVLEPEMGAQITQSLKRLDDMDLQAAETKNTAMGAAAQSLMSVPVEQREEMLRIIAPQMIQSGWTGEELAQADLSDQALQMYIGQAVDVDAMIDNELAEREFQAGKVMSFQPGGGVLRVTPEGSEILAAPEGFQGGQAQGGQPTNSQPSTMTAADFSRVLQGFGGDAAQAARYTQESNMAVQVNSPQEASMLPPGTLYITPDGQEYER